MHTLSLAHCLAAFPMLLITSPIMAYNLLLLSGFVLAGLTCYLLARHLGLSTLAALVAAFLFDFSQFHLIHAQSHLNIAGVQWLPLLILLMLIYLKKGGLWLGTACGAVLGINALTSWYYGLYGAMMVIISALFTMRPSWQGIKDTASRLAMVLFVALILLSYPLFGVLRAIAGGASPITTKAEIRDYSADIIAYLLPSPLSPMFSKVSSAAYGRMNGNLVEQSVYLGLPLLALAGIALLKGAVAKRGYLAFIAIFFGLLSLGPKPAFMGRDIPILSHILGIPYRFLLDNPLAAGARAPARMAIIALLALALLAGAGMTWLIKHRQWIILGVICLALLLDHLPVPLCLQEAHFIENEAVYQDAQEGSWVDIPLDPNMRQYQLNQTFHGGKLLAGYHARTPQAYIKPLETQPILRWFYSGGTLPQHISLAEELPYFARLFDIKYIAVHRRFLSADDFTATVAALDQLPFLRHTSLQDMEIFELGQLKPIERSRLIRLRAWDQPEFYADLNLAYTWSTDTEAWIGLIVGRDKPSMLELYMLPLVDLDKGEQYVKFYYQDGMFASIPLGRGWKRYEIKLPDELRNPGAYIIRLKFSYLVEPRQLCPLSEDKRRLSVAIATPPPR